MISSMWSLVDVLCSEPLSEPTLQTDGVEPVHGLPDTERPSLRWARNVLSPPAGSVVDMPLPSVSLQDCISKNHFMFFFVV